MANIYLHLGYPKTGTTTLQKNVFPHLKNVEYLGKFYQNELAYYKLSKKKYYDFDELINQVCQENYKNSSFFISNEDLIFDLLRTKIDDSQQTKELFQQFLSKINKISQTNNLKIILFKRRQDELIHSLYAQSYSSYFINTPRANNFKSFVSLFLENKGFILEYNSILNQLSCNSAHVFDTKEFFLDQNQFLKKFQEKTSLRIKKLHEFIPNENKRRIGSSVKIAKYYSLYDFFKHRLFIFHPIVKLFNLKPLMIMLQKIKLRAPHTVEMDLETKNKILFFYKSK